jgi:hypothetical protein
MSIPRNRAVRRIGPQPDPLIAQPTQDPIRLKLGDVSIRLQISDSFFFSTFSPSTFGGRVGVSDGLGGGFGGKGQATLSCRRSRRGRGRYASRRSRRRMGEAVIWWWEARGGCQRMLDFGGSKHEIYEPERSGIYAKNDIRLNEQLTISLHVRPICEP